MWTPRVICVSVGLDESGYAHQVVNGNRQITVTHHTHRNYDCIDTKDIGGGYVRRTGIGRREPDLTPHPECFVIANALNAALAAQK
jgi:hypothetical protein